MARKKWTRGRSYSPVEALAAIDARLPVYFNHKWTHNAWARSWQVNLLIASARAGRIFEAIPIDGDDSERDRAD